LRLKTLTLNNLSISIICFFHAVLITLSSSNLIFLDLLGPLQSIISTTLIGLIFILISSFRIFRQKIDLPLTIILGLLLFFAVLSNVINPSINNFIFSFRDLIWLVFCFILFHLDVNLEYFKRLTNLSSILMIISLVSLIYLSWSLGISFKDINIDIYNDLDQASMRDLSAFENRFRFTIPGLNANTTAVILLNISLMIFCLLRDKKNKIQKYLFFPLGLFCFFFLATFSKTVLVLFIVSILVLSYGKLIKKRMLIFYAILGLTLIWIIEPLIIYRLISIYDLIAGTEIGDEFIGRTSNRSESLQTSLQLIFSNPLGISFDNYKFIGYSSFGGGEHNNYIYMTILYGIPFGILYFIFFLSIAFRSFLTFRRYAGASFNNLSRRLSLLSLTFSINTLLLQLVAPVPILALIIASLCLLINRNVVKNDAPIV